MKGGKSSNSTLQLTAILRKEDDKLVAELVNLHTCRDAKKKKNTENKVKKHTGEGSGKVQPGTNKAHHNDIFCPAVEA